MGGAEVVPSTGQSARRVARAEVAARSRPQPQRKQRQRKRRNKFLRRKIDNVATEKGHKKEERVDSRYGSPAVARLITTVMKRGKKSLAERIVYTAIEKSREGSDSVDPLEVVNKAIENVRPRLEVKSRRVGGATYQVPLEVPPARQISLATRW